MAFKKEDVVIIEPKEMFVGKKDAPVTLMEFGEYENEDCAKANEIVKQLLEEYEGKIKFQFRQMNLLASSFDRASLEIDPQVVIGNHPACRSHLFL